MTQEDKEKLKSWRLQKLEGCKQFPKYFYYFSFLDNLESIISNGILSKNEITKKKINTKSFADVDVQNYRKDKDFFITGSQRKNLHDLVPLYLNSKTPTLYARKDIQNQLFFLSINSKKLITDMNINFAFTDGNATNQITKSYWKLDNLKNLNWEIINGLSWNDKQDGKRIRNSEFLIFPKIETKYIETISCYDAPALLRIATILKGKNLKIETMINKNLFF